MLCGLLLCLGTNCDNGGASSDRVEEKAVHPGTFQTIEKKYPNSAVDGYNLYFPPAYEAHPDTMLPLIVFLQGGLSVGGWVGDIFKWELPRELKESADISSELGQLKRNTFIYVMPHIARGEYYLYVDAFEQLLDELTNQHRIDTSRIYLTGLSRGGFGTWGLASKMPERFAAVAPIAGAPHGVRDYEALAQVPTWAAHNHKDDRVDFLHSENAVRRVERTGGVEFHRTTSVAEVDYLKHDHIFTAGTNSDFPHDAWTAMYNEVNFYKWLLRFELE